MPHGPKKPLLPAGEVLEILDSTVTELSRTAVEFARRMEEEWEQPEALPCLYQWHKLEKAALKLLQAREIEHETLAQVALLSAQKELIARAVALMDCLSVTGGRKDPSAPNLRHPGRRTRRHPWGRQHEDEWTGEEA
jgi:hypothetical protein